MGSLNFCSDAGKPQGESNTSSDEIASALFDMFSDARGVAGEYILRSDTLVHHHGGRHTYFGRLEGGIRHVFKQTAVTHSEFVTDTNTDDSDAAQQEHQKILSAMDSASHIDLVEFPSRGAAVSFLESSGWAALQSTCAPLVTVVWLHSTRPSLLSEVYNLFSQVCFGIDLC